MKPKKGKQRPPRRLRPSALPVVAYVRCIRRLCRVLLEGSLLQWIHTLTDCVAEGPTARHYLAVELLDQFHARNPAKCSPPPHVDRVYAPVRMRTSEFLLSEWPLHTLQRMRLLVEPICDLVTNFVHASVVRTRPLPPHTHKIHTTYTHK